MSDIQENFKEKRKNRKRKSFLKNARKYAKQGKFGRGSRVSEDTCQYFVRVLETYKAGFPTYEEKVMFANNVLNQTENEEINYSCNQIGCRIIETLLPFASDENLNRFTKVFSDNLRQYLSDRFASHVIQALLRICCAKSLTETNEEMKENCKQYTLKISKFLLNNLEDFINDTYGNHVIREVLQTLARIPKEDNDKIVKKEDQDKKIKEENKVKKTEIKDETDIPQEYIEIVKEYAQRLLMWPHFKDLPFDELNSGLLQVLLVAVKNTDSKLLKKIVKKLLEESFSVVTDPENEENQLKDVFKNKPATILLETSIAVATPKLFTQIYAKCFVGSLATLAKNKETNFAVQKLLNYCNEKTEFEAIFDELSDHFESIISCGYTGVISSLATNCKRLSAKQGPFVQSLMKALHCIEPQERQNYFVPSVIRLIPYERVEAAQKEKYFVNLHGSLIIQSMLEFNKPIKIVNSILNMEPNDVKNLFCDPKGSHVCNSFMESQYIGEKNRDKLIWRLLGTYQELASSKHGSRSLDAIWNVVSLKLKMKIMDELSHKDGLWRNTPSGNIIASKITLDLYKRNVEQWKQNQEKSNTTKDMFADIIDEK